MCSSQKKFKFFTNFHIFSGRRDPDSLEILGTGSRESSEKFPDCTSLLENILFNCQPLKTIIKIDAFFTYNKVYLNYIPIKILRGKTQRETSAMSITLRVSERLFI